MRISLHPFSEWVLWPADHFTSVECRFEGRPGVLYDRHTVRWMFITVTFYRLRAKQA